MTNKSIGKSITRLDYATAWYYYARLAFIASKTAFLIDKTLSAEFALESNYGIKYAKQALYSEQPVVQTQ